MAKRKRGIAESTSNKKRLKGASPRKKHTHGDVDPDRDYKVKSIVDESATRYLISWEDDEVSGERYADTWEPKRNANQLAVDDWERQKAERKKAANSDTRQTTAISSSPPATPNTASPQKRAKARRERRIINSSSSAEEPITDTVLNRESQRSPEIGESQPEPLTPAAPSDQDHRKQITAAVQPSSPPASYRAGEYQKIPTSQLASLFTQRRDSRESAQPLPAVQHFIDLTQPSGDISATPATHAHTSLSTPAGIGESATKIIPDSQAVNESTELIIETNLPPPFQPVDSSLIGAQPASATHSAPPVDSHSNGQLNGLSPDRISAEAVTEHSIPATQSAHRGKTPVQTSHHPTNTSSVEANAPGDRELDSVSNAHPSIGIIPKASLPDSRDLDFASQPPSHEHDNATLAFPASTQLSTTLVPIDLTRTQQDPSSISKFTVTPPVRTARREADQQRQVVSNNFQSSFLLQTQLFEHAATTGAASVPLERSSNQIITSPITPVPSQSIFATGTLEGSAPPPPPSLSTQSTPGMDSSQKSTPSGSSMAEQLKAMRAQSRLDRAARMARSGSAATSDPSSSSIATSEPTSEPLISTSLAGAQPLIRSSLGSPFLFAQDAARSPSAVPADEPLPVITLEEMNTSGRYETLLPQAQTNNSNETSQNGILVSATSTDGPQDVALPPDNKSQKEMALQRTNTHAVPIYLIGHQRDQYPEMVYFYKETVQRFLATRNPDEALISEARELVKRVQHITTHPDLDNSETNYTQYDVPASQQADWDARCSAKFRFLKELFASLRDTKLCVAIIAAPGQLVRILETFLEGIRVPYERPGMPQESNASEGIRTVLLGSNSETAVSQSVDLVIAIDNTVDSDSRQVQELRRDGSVPFISLVVPRTVEHVEQCISARLPPLAHLRALVSGIYQYRDEAGRSEGPGFPKPSAALLAEYLKGERGQTWPLPPLIDLKDFDSQTDSEVGEQAVQPPTAGDKRMRDSQDVEDEPMASKRSRVESPADGTPLVSQQQEGDTTHISDSIEKVTQSGLPKAEVESSPALTPNELRLQKLLVEKQDQLDEHVRVLAELQFRFEEQRAKLHEVTTERNSAIDTAQQAVLRLTEESNRMSNLRTENSRLKEELREANAKLLDSSIPERVELEAVRQNLARATLEGEKATKRLDQANKDAAWARDLYQSASASAQTSAAQVTELESQLAAAEARATGEQARLRQMGFDDFTKNLRHNVHRLKALVKEQDAALRARDEEIIRLKEASRGRMGTRGTSLPRSPKPGSRQTSPNAVESSKGRTMGLHPLRNG